MWNIAIVTGGNRGIGLGIADKLASLGAKVIVAAIHEEKTKHTFIHCDVSDMNDVKAMVAELARVSPVARPHINLFGRYEFGKPVEPIDLERVVLELARMPALRHSSSASV